MRNRWAGMVVAWLVLRTAIAGSADQAVPRAEHPRPDACRDEWLNLNGAWQFAFDPKDRGLQENWQTEPRRFDRRILVPFGWQSRLSGLADASRQRVGWYCRTIRVPPTWAGKRVWLHFDAVDCEARVWVNGQSVGSHEGGYTPFQFDVTQLAGPGSEATVVLRARDATDPELPLGKQAAGWYTPTSGIWQTVWLEARPAAYVESFRLTPAVRRGRWVVDAQCRVQGPTGRAELEIASSDPTVHATTVPVTISQGAARVDAVVSIDAARLWTPDDPHLVDLEIRLKDADGVVDLVHTYVGLRTVGRGKYEDMGYESVLLNGEPIYLRGVLDQSFNSEGIYTAPSDEFIRRDLEIARQAGFNLLRIHVKSEEPRKLYWADRMGLLIVQDMPCTFQQSPRSRQAWQQTMQETILRDVNHPSVIAWSLFNESWGLGGSRYKQDPGAQNWVLQMWREAKQKLDPSRLVDDNSPCSWDHVKTDLNSWHFYIDDYVEAQARIADMVKNTQRGSTLNYVPGRAQDGAPLWNSEYGAVGSRGGDRDISWGFRYLTTQLRRHELIQGYTYSELCDVEWEHNGVVNYDRSRKEFGYDSFVPGMTVADLQGADFVGFDTPPAVEAAPGEQISLPIFVSHFSARSETPALQWHISGTDDLGRPVATEPRSRRVTWQRYRVTFQKPLRIRMPADQAFVGALALELLDEKGKRIAANFVNLVVRRRPAETFSGPAPAKQPSSLAQNPRVEVLGPRLVAVRFDPCELAAFRTDRPDWDWLENRGKFYAYGQCEVEYHLALPKFVLDAIPAQVALMAELATKADDQRLDWPAVRQPLDYPQTQQRQHPGKVSVWLSGDKPADRRPSASSLGVAAGLSASEERAVGEANQGAPRSRPVGLLGQFDLPDDPADSRGVLSHLAGYQHGSYGYLIRAKVDLTESPSLRKALIEKPFVPLVFRAEGEGCGLSIYGERLGRYPIDPMIIVQTALDLSRPVGWISAEPVMTDRLLDRIRLVGGILTSDAGGHTWRFTTEKPADGWAEPEFDDASWKTAPRMSPGELAGAPWSATELWLRTDLTLPSQPAGMVLRYACGGDADVYVNGESLLRLRGGTRDFQQRALRKNELGLFREGRNSIAVCCRQPNGGRGIDLGIRWVEIAPQP